MSFYWRPAKCECGASADPDWGQCFECFCADRNDADAALQRDYDIQMQREYEAEMEKQYVESVKAPMSVHDPAEDLEVIP